MKQIDSTAEIVALKALNRNVDEKWVDWAVDMLVAGFDTEHLVILAGESKPYNQFQLQNLTDKVFNEMHLDYSDKDKAIKNYACYLIDKVLNNDIEILKVLNILKDICIELDYEKYLFDFYLLYFTKVDLSYSENQYYWNGATRENIDSIIIDYFTKWKDDYFGINKSMTS
jgi:hypothetical protein